MRFILLPSVFIVVAFSLSAVACGGTSQDPSNQTQADAGAGDATPATSDGFLDMPNPSAAYCAKLGYVNQGESCVFPDKTSCEPWAFFRGTCGQAFSYCNQHGGTVSNVVRNQGTFTTSQAVCTLSDGTQCSEYDFMNTGVCK